jgi:glutathione S-transferase
MYPKDLKHRAAVNRWLLWEASAWFPSCYIYLVEYVVKPLLSAEPDQKVIDAEAPKWHQHASILDEQLGKTKFLAGDNITIADIAVAAPMHMHEAQRLPLEQHANLKRWMDEIEKLPAWQKTQAAVDKALLPNKAAEGTSSNGGSR